MVISLIQLLTINNNVYSYQNGDYQSNDGDHDYHPLPPPPHIIIIMVFSYQDVSASDLSLPQKHTGSSSEAGAAFAFSKISHEF